MSSRWFIKNIKVVRFLSWMLSRFTLSRTILYLGAGIMSWDMISIRQFCLINHIQLLYIFIYCLAVVKTQIGPWSLIYSGDSRISQMSWCHMRMGVPPVGRCWGCHVNMLLWVKHVFLSSLQLAHWKQGITPYRLLYTKVSITYYWKHRTNNLTI